jgi:hypothetical protein
MKETRRTKFIYEWKSANAFPSGANVSTIKKDKSTSNSPSFYLPVLLKIQVNPTRTAQFRGAVPDRNESADGTGEK